MYLSREGLGELVAWIVVINNFFRLVLFLFVLFRPFRWFRRRLRRGGGRGHRERTSGFCSRLSHVLFECFSLHTLLKS